MLANLYLHSFDQFITTRSKAYVRYADDFIILCESKEQAEKILKEASIYLAKQLKLKLNEPQISETKNGFEFLGITVNNKSLSISDKKKEELLQRINSFVLEEGCFTPKNLRAWNGIKIYYGALLPQLSLLELDNALFEKMQSLASSFAKSIPNQSILARSLRELDFLSEDMLLKKVKLHKEIIDIYLVEKGKTKAQTANLQNQNIINQRKREYHKKENEGSELIINTFGAYIGISNQGITVKKEGKIIHQHPVGVLNHITISTQGVSLSSNAIYYCLENKISIDFFDGYGKHAGSILTPNLTECTLWEKQSALSVEKRKELAVNIIIGKLKNQINLIKYYHKYHKNTHLELSEKYTSISKEFGQLVCRLKSEISADKDYRKIVMAIEAQGAVLYWDYIRELVSDDKIGFDKREHQGATDIFNSMLNYGYSILYARIWQALLGAKLNPSDSFIHVRQSGKPTFAYDIIELFRSQVVDRVVISLVQKSIPLKMKQDRLDDNTKKILLKGILERLNRYEKYRGEEIKLEQIIKKQTKEIACFIENNSHYKPYIAKW